MCDNMCCYISHAKNECIFCMNINTWLCKKIVCREFLMSKDELQCNRICIKKNQLLIK